MRAWLTCAGVVAAVAMTASRPLGQEHPPVPFRTSADGVTVGVSVKRGNVPIANLRDVDFRLLDGGVAQAIQAVDLGEVPLDITFIADTSGSTAGALSQVTGDVRKMVALIGRQDRFRLLTIGVNVNTVVPWHQGADREIPPLSAVAGVSLVYDVLFVGLAHRPPGDRRHLVIAVTDGRDCGSVVDGPGLVRASERSEAVLHWIEVAAQGTWDLNAAPAWCSPMETAGTKHVERAAGQTGGRRHGALFARGVVSTFKSVLEDFRRSYVLRYTPTGVPSTGWHPIRVEVPGHPGARIAARAGYWTPTGGSGR